MPTAELTGPPAGPSQPPQPPTTPVGSAWQAFRAWRRARPFWAGIILAIAGAELLLIPLPIHAMGLILHIGTGGVLGILIGAILIVCALLIMFNPAQRVFYSIVAVLLAVAALVASNLGGFLIGTLLGVVGGSLGFGWAPGRPDEPPRRAWWRRGPASAARGGADAGLATASGGESPEGTAGGGRPGSGGATVLWAGAPLPILILLTLLGLPPSPGTPPSNPTPPVTSPTPTPSPSATPTGSPSPSGPGRPSPSGSPSASPTGSPTPGPSGRPTTSAGPLLSPGPAGSASASPSPRHGSAPGFAIASVPATLKASSALITGFAYDGLVSVPTAGGTVQMMQFSASSIDLGSIALTAGRSGSSMTTTAPALTLTGHVTLYATQLSGDLLGVPITLTPSSPLSAILAAIAPLTKTIPVPMTNVVVDQPYSSANGMSVSGLLES